MSASFAFWPAPVAGARHELPATPDTCCWGYLDRDQPPCLEVDHGDVIAVEAVTHHAGDAPDLMMDPGIRKLWDGILAVGRGPGVHLLTGPLRVRGAEPGDTLAVRVLSLRPRLPYGSNVAAHWGLLHDRFGKERVTIYGLDGSAPDAAGDEDVPTARPLFGFDFTTRPLYDLPGVVTEPDPQRRRRFGRQVVVPVRPHLGVMGVAPDAPGRHSSIPPGCFGGNVDNWRLGAGTTMCYPVLVPGALLSLGDPHFAQGDGEVCGTAIEASLDAVIQVALLKDVAVTAPVLETPTAWYTHGFGATLDEAMRMAVEQMLWLLCEQLELDADEAYSLASVAVDVGITQVVDGVLGCHAAVARSLLR